MMFAVALNRLLPNHTKYTNLLLSKLVLCDVFFFQAEDGIRDLTVTGFQTCALPISEGLHLRIIDVKSLRVNDPEVQALRQQAAAALEIADHATAFARLTRARTIVTTKRETLARVLDDQKREEAALVFEQARVELARLAYEQAAELFGEAVRLLPAGDTETRWRYTMEKADAEQTMGDERGNNPALVQAIESYRVGLALASRAERPLNWAGT